MPRKLGRREILNQIPAARAAGRRARRQPWWPTAARYDRSRDCIIVVFRDGKSLTVPRVTLPELRAAKLDQLEDVRLTGDALRWEGLDVDVSVPALIGDWLGPRFSTIAAGRQGGSSRSPAKTAAARANGIKGGRPPK